MFRIPQITPSFLATCGICTVIFTHGYLTVSVMTYSGFMAMDLVEGVTDANAGYYSGLLSGSMMVGCTASAYLWGKAADIYGRRTVLHMSLLLSAACSLAFGMSSRSFAWALASRFLLGICNALVAPIKTLSTELSGGDQNAEVAYVGMGFTTLAWSALMAPVLGGALVKPTQQYPGWFEGLQDTARNHFLERHPYFLANALGSFFCIATMGVLKFLLYETLPGARHPKHIPRDLFLYLFRHCCRGICRRKKKKRRTGETGRLLAATTAAGTPADDEFEDEEEEKEEPVIPDKPTVVTIPSSSVVPYGSIQNRKQSYTEDSLLPILNEDTEVNEEELMQQVSDNIMSFTKDDIADAIHSTVMGFSGEEAMLLAGREARSKEEALVDDITRRASLKTEKRRMHHSIQQSLLLATGTSVGSEITSPPTSFRQQQGDAFSESGGDDSSSFLDSSIFRFEETTIASIWAMKNTRRHIIVGGILCFTQVLAAESLPLFLMAGTGGLGLSAITIGAIISLSSAAFIKLNYVVYAGLMHQFGLYGSLRVAVMLKWPCVALVPLVLWINNKGPIVDHVEGLSLTVPGYGTLSWWALLYLAVISSVYRLTFSVSSASIMLAMNRTVTHSQRATVNGLATWFTSLARSIAPPVAGFIVAFSLSSGVFEPVAGAVSMFLFLALVDGASSFSAVLFLREEIDNEKLLRKI